MLTENLIEKAKELAFINMKPPGRAHVAACAQLGKTQWMGINSSKTHPEALKTFRNGEQGSCLHAEIDAIVKIPRDTRHKIKLFVMRFRKDGILTMARPCRMCRTFMNKVGVDAKNVYYTNWDGEWEKLEM